MHSDQASEPYSSSPALAAIIIIIIIFCGLACTISMPELQQSIVPCPARSCPSLTWNLVVNTYIWKYIYLYIVSKMICMACMPGVGCWVLGGCWCWCYRLWVVVLGWRAGISATYQPVHHMDVEALHTVHIYIYIYIYIYIFVYISDTMQHTWTSVDCYFQLAMAMSVMMTLLTLWRWRWIRNSCGHSRSTR